MSINSTVKTIYRIHASSTQDALAELARQYKNLNPNVESFSFTDKDGTRVTIELRANKGATAPALSVVPKPLNEEGDKP